MIYLFYLWYQRLKLTSSIYLALWLVLLENIRPILPQSPSIKLDYLHKLFFFWLECINFLFDIMRIKSHKYFGLPLSKSFFIFLFFSLRKIMLKFFLKLKVFKYKSKKIKKIWVKVKLIFLKKYSSFSFSDNFIFFFFTISFLSLFSLYNFFLQILVEFSL